MESVQNGQFERRENPRINLETKISIRTSDMEPSMLGWIQNISRGGFKLKSDNPLITKDVFRSGKEIFFETYEDFFRLKGKGEVIWASMRKNEAGIKFDELDQKGKKFLNDFLGMF
jgi:hypothetical protein